MKRNLVLFIVIVTLVLAWSPTELASAQDTFPRLDAGECPIAVPDSPPIECSYLVVPEDYLAPEGKKIRLPVIVIHSVASVPAPDPILFTEGGPGFSSLSAVWWFADSAYVEERDIIILEQRGNLYAEPSLTCDASIWREEKVGNTGCLDSLRERGIDPADYTMRSIVADIEALRQVFDYDSWNLYGTSFSTRLMQLMMALHPEGIRSVMLQSISPLTDTRYQHDPEHTARALKVMVDDCAANAACAKAYPNLEADFYDLFKKLNKEPIPFEFTDPQSGDPLVATVDGFRLLGWMVEDSFYGPAWAPHMTAYMPLLIDQVNRGNTDLLYPWLREQLIGLIAPSSFSWGMYFSVFCQDDANSVTSGIMAAQAAAYPQLGGYIRHAREVEICDIWNLPPSSPLVAGPVTSDIPTLILAGGYDPITPPAWSRSVAEQLTNSYYYEFPAAGHSIDHDNPCAEEIKAAFFKDPATAPDASCVASVPDPEFVLPEEVYVAPGVYHMMYDVSLGDPQRGEPLLEAIAATCIIIFLAEIGFLVAAGTILLARRRRIEAKSDQWVLAGHLMAGMASVLAIATTQTITHINNYFLNADPLMLRFGLPTNFAPALQLGLLALAMTILAIGLTLVAIGTWIRRDWPWRMRAFFTLVTLSAIAFAGMLARWDLVSLLL